MLQVQADAFSASGPHSTPASPSPSPPPSSDGDSAVEQEVVRRVPLCGAARPAASTGLAYSGNDYLLSAINPNEPQYVLRNAAYQP